MSFSMNPVGGAWEGPGWHVHGVGLLFSFFCSCGGFGGSTLGLEFAMHVLYHFLPLVPSCQLVSFSLSFCFSFVFIFL
jgi:hypothetical protein